MALCKKGYTLETKVCGINCAECEHYDTRNKKQRLKDEAIENGIKFREQMEKDLKEFVPPKHCSDGCKYCADEGFGFLNTCEAQGKPIYRYTKMSEFCPFWKNRKNKKIVTQYGAEVEE